MSSQKSISTRKVSVFFLATKGRHEFVAIIIIKIMNFRRRRRHNLEERGKLSLDKKILQGKQKQLQENKNKTKQNSGTNCDTKTNQQKNE